MSPQLEEDMFRRWPSFFPNRKDRAKSGMYYGFTCRDGGHRLVFDLLTEIERLLEANPMDEPFEVEQVKEKFGQLRVYVEPARKDISEAIDIAEAESVHICEVCSKPGVLIVGSPWGTRCPEHARDITVDIEFPNNDWRALDQVQPQVGIFWLIDSQLVLYGSSLNRATLRDGIYSYAQSHPDVWNQASVHADLGASWDQFPRGRVSFSVPAQRFSLYADTCILNRPEVVGSIVSLFRLPDDIAISADGDHRCAVCIAGESQS